MKFKSKNAPVTNENVEIIEKGAKEKMEVNYENMLAKKDKVYTIAGKCCESGDLLAEDVYIAKPKRVC